MNLVVSIKGWAVYGQWICRLAKYELQSNYTITRRTWHFDVPSVIPSTIVVGTVPIDLNNQYKYPCSRDKDCEIQCLSRVFVPPDVLTGTYSIIGDVLTIYWANGQVESWLNDGIKWTLSAASFLLSTNKWGVAFSSDGAAPTSQTGAFPGRYSRYNGWNGIDTPDAPDVFNSMYFAITSTNIMRSVLFDCGAHNFVFKYLAMIGDVMIYQVSHDMDNDGMIASEIGHTYIGLKIVQNGIHKGYVFIECSIAGQFGHTFGASYYYGV